MSIQAIAREAYEHGKVVLGLDVIRVHNVLRKNTKMSLYLRARERDER